MVAIDKFQLRRIEDNFMSPFNLETTMPNLMDVMLICRPFTTNSKEGHLRVPLLAIRTYWFGNWEMFDTNIVPDEIPRVATNNCQSNCRQLLTDITVAIE